MTLNNVSDIDVLLAERADNDRRIAQAVARRAQDLHDAQVAAQARFEEESRNAQVAQRAQLQDHLDAQAVLNEEVAQLSFVNGGSLVPEDDADGAELTGPIDTTPTYSRFSIRCWGWLSWLLAAFGLLIAVAVANRTDSWFTHDLLGFDNGFWQFVLGIPWWVCVLGVGFFGGGTLGTLFNRGADDE